MSDIYKKGITHTGVFHADDVFATALLKVLFPKIEIERVKTLPSINDKSTIVYDIGFGRFDHHQQNAKVRENGVKYSSFGLLWKEYGKTLLHEKWIEFDEMFVLPIDIQDNGGKDNPLSNAIKAFNANWDDVEESDKAFDKAVNVAKIMIEKSIKKLKSEEHARVYVSNAIENSKDKEIIILDKFAPWQEEVCKTKTAIYVIYPSLRGGWNAQAVPVEYGKKEYRLLFPSDWLSHKPDSLSFVHPSRFLISSNDKGDLLNLCKDTIHKKT